MPASLHRTLALCGLVAWLVPAAGCNTQATVRKLEAKKAELLASTRPKAEFWDQVGRKGDALKKEQAAAAELAGVRQQIAGAEAALQQVRQRVASARATNAEAADVLSRQQGQQGQLDQALTKQKATLAGFETRHRKGSGT